MLYCIYVRPHCQGIFYSNIKCIAAYIQHTLLYRQRWNEIHNNRTFHIVLYLNKRAFIEIYVPASSERGTKETNEQKYSKNKIVNLNRWWLWNEKKRVTLKYFFFHSNANKTHKHVSTWFVMANWWHFAYQAIRPWYVWMNFSNCNFKGARN